MSQNSANSGKLIRKAWAREVTFPDDQRIFPEYRGKKLIVSGTEDSVSIDGRELTGYTREYATTLAQIPFYLL